MESTRQYTPGGAGYYWPVFNHYHWTGVLHFHSQRREHHNLPIGNRAYISGAVKGQVWSRALWAREIIGFSLPSITP